MDVQTQQRQALLALASLVNPEGVKKISDAEEAQRAASKPQPEQGQTK